MAWKGVPLTAERVRDLLFYDRETGAFFWRNSWRNRVAGSRAGSSTTNGYNQLCIDGRSHRAARIAWLWVTGTLPAESVDHINRNRADDRWANLRLASISQNNANQSARRENGTGLRGVCYIKTQGRYRAMLQGKRGTKGLFIGMFDTPEEASAAYLEKLRQKYGDFAPA